MVPRTPQLLDDNDTDDNRKFVHSFPLGSGSASCCVQGGGGRVERVSGVLFATLGADIGALINYYLARWIGRPLVYRFAGSRFGHMCLIDREKVDKAERYFDRHGAVSTFVGRLVPAVRQLISIPAGLAKDETVHVPHIYHFGCGTVESILAAIAITCIP